MSLGKVAAPKEEGTFLLIARLTHMIETYKIAAKGQNWAVDHDGQLEGDYVVTKEGAFVSAAMAASNAIKDDVDVSITVPARCFGRSSSLRNTMRRSGLA